MYTLLSIRVNVIGLVVTGFRIYHTERLNHMYFDMERADIFPFTWRLGPQSIAFHDWHVVRHSMWTTPITDDQYTALANTVGTRYGYCDLLDAVHSAHIISQQRGIQEPSTAESLGYTPYWPGVDPARSSTDFYIPRPPNILSGLMDTGRMLSGLPPEYFTPIEEEPDEDDGY